MTEPEIHDASWALAKVPRGAILGRSSKRHFVIGGNELALCGTRVQWIRMHASHEDDCRPCRRILQKRYPETYEDWYGERPAPTV